MRVKEFSSSFDTLLNSYAVAAGFGSTDNPVTIELDEYEKSVFLTEAQEEVALSLYSGRNSSLQGFEETEELRRYLSDLIAEAELSPLSSLSGKPIGIDSRSRFFTLPENLWLITYESVKVSDGKCGSGASLEVVPVRQDEYHRIRKNPFRGANDRRALRLDLSDGNVEIVSSYTVASYYIRYLRRLRPIILSVLDDQSIEGTSTVSECELPATIHRRILERAVEKALQSRGYGRNNTENR